MNNYNQFKTTVLQPPIESKYVAHLKRHHPGCPIPTEREYWHKRWADQETNPGSRCC
ncbi:YbdD/YjiX family protein [Corynebacterium diphtheriae]|uniref:YbdD/YjiX family protein n=1 Tax=Corynebacterium diphtheriae TaxID=1717 RepID=UPI000A1F6000|nr:YbdD/YjiX family protein [Corynebacterium diphtheriae]OSQ20858.1 hypothetical protein B9J72_11710 [Corynebacterium diphtheriae]